MARPCARCNLLGLSWSLRGSLLTHRRPPTAHSNRLQACVRGLAISRSATPCGLRRACRLCRSGSLPRPADPLCRRRGGAPASLHRHSTPGTRLSTTSSSGDAINGIPAKPARQRNGQLPLERSPACPPVRTSNPPCRWYAGIQRQRDPSHTQTVKLPHAPLRSAFTTSSGSAAPPAPSSPVLRPHHEPLLLSPSLESLSFPIGLLRRV
jgi:hypothetical protein